jgi:hypothetical protein
MEIVTPDAPVAESSPAIEVPRDSADYATWRQTGRVPAAKSAPPKADPAPAKESSAAGDKPAEKAAPASEAGTHQEKNKPRDNAATRLNELLEDLRKAGMTPAELKVFKREAQKDSAEPPKDKAAPEQTANPAEMKAPVKPKQDDYKTYAEYDAAKDKYYEDLADYRAAKRVEAYQQEQQQRASQASVHEKMTEAKGRYGDEAVGIISATARAFTGDQQIPQAVKAILNDSPVWTDLLYTLGSKPAELDGFIQLAKSDPGAAIRKAVLMEQLVQTELAKGGKKPEAGGEDAVVRDDSGKFKKTTPEKKESDAPPPPKEVSGRGTPPADEVERAVKTSDFAAFKRSQNARDLARRRG